MGFRAQASQWLHHILLIDCCLLKRTPPFFRHFFRNLLSARLVVMVHLLRSIGRWWTELRIAFGNRGLELVVKIFEAFGAQVSQSFVRRTVEDELAAHHHHDFVEELNVFHRMRRENNGTTALGYLPEELHDFFFGS